MKTRPFIIGDIVNCPQGQGIIDEDQKSTDSTVSVHLIEKDKTMVLDVKEVTLLIPFD